MILLADEHDTHRGIKPEGLKQIFTVEKINGLKYDAKIGYPFAAVRVEDPELIAELEKAGIPFRGQLSNTWLPTIISWIVPVALFFIIMSYLIKRMGGGAPASCKSARVRPRSISEKRPGSLLPTSPALTKRKKSLSKGSNF